MICLFLELLAMVFGTIRQKSKNFYKDYEIKILISSEDSFQSNTFIYKGNILDKSIENTKNKIALLRNTIETDDELKKYYKGNSRKLKIQTTDIPFTVVYVGIDIDSNNKKKILKVTQYIPKYETADCPSIIIDSINNSSLFAYYNNAIKDLWETSKPLDDN